MNLTILGSTGSIGVSTLDVVARHPGRYRIMALTAQRRDDVLFEQCVQFKPRYAVLLDEAAAQRLQQRMAIAGLEVEVLCGVAALERVASLPEVDTVMAAIVGAAGLLPTLAAARAGKKILLANKEVLVMAGRIFMDAVRLHGATPDAIQVVIHPQSVIHSLVQYVDGSVLAQLGNPDMRTPIAYALAYPERIESGVAPLDLLKVATLNFEAPDVVRFPCLALAYQALRAGGTAPAVLNAANEVAVAAFLDHQISFLTIPRLIEDVLAALPVSAIATLEDVLVADAAARAAALELMQRAASLSPQSSVLVL